MSQACGYPRRLIESKRSEERRTRVRSQRGRWRSEGGFVTTIFLNYTNYTRYKARFCPLISIQIQCHAGQTFSIQVKAL